VAAGFALGPRDAPGRPLTPALCPQIASLLKDHERIQAGQTSAPSDDDSDIKKIKKVGGGGGRRGAGARRGWHAWQPCARGWPRRWPGNPSEEVPLLTGRGFEEEN